MISGTLTDRLFSIAKSAGNKIALRENSGKTITWQELSRQIEEFSRHLLQSDIQPGARVAVLQPKCIESVVAIFSILKCNAVYVPIDPEMSSSRIQLVLRDADPDLLIADPSRFPSDIPCQLELCTRVEGLEKTAITILSKGENRDHNLAYILYTSGSTGAPKGVCVSTAAAEAFVNWCINKFRLNPEDRVASIAAFHFDLSIFDLFATLFSGSTLHLFNAHETKNARLMAQEINTQNISVVYATPSFLSSMILYGKPGKYEWKSLRKVLFAGEVFPVALLHQLMDFCVHAEFFNLYGPTETNVCTWAKIIRDNNRMQPYPIGVPCEGHEFEISPDGELYIGGPHVAEGYLNNAVLTNARFFTRNNRRWFKTGDLVNQENDGALVYAGRIDRMIKRRGYRIEPAEIEAMLQRNPAIQTCAVTEITGDYEIPIVVAFVTGEQAPGITEVKEFLLKLLPDYMLPDQVVVVAQLPLTANGKVDYIHLRKMYAETHGKV